MAEKEKNTTKCESEEDEEQKNNTFVNLNRDQQQCNYQWLITILMKICFLIGLVLFACFMMVSWILNVWKVVVAASEWKYSQYVLTLNHFVDVTMGGTKIVRLISSFFLFSIYFVFISSKIQTRNIFNKSYYFLIYLCDLFKEIKMSLKLGLDRNIGKIVQYLALHSKLVEFQWRLF